MLTYSEIMRKLRDQSRSTALQPVKPEPPPPVPVLDQLRAHFAKLPQATVMRPWGLDELRSQVVGRFGRPPQRGEVAAALKVLGFQPVRLHGSGYGSRRYWIPTGYDLQPKTERN